MQHHTQKLLFLSRLKSPTVNKSTGVSITTAIQVIQLYPQHNKKPPTYKAEGFRSK